MHEFALSEEIVRAALAAADARPESVRSLTVRVGALSGTSIGALEFSLGVVLEQSRLTHASARIVEVAARVRCECGVEYEPPDIFTGCPSCDGFRREILDGSDVTLETIEVDDE